MPKLVAVAVKFLFIGSAYVLVHNVNAFLGVLFTIAIFILVIRKIDAIIEAYKEERAAKTALKVQKFKAELDDYAKSCRTDRTKQ